VTTAGVDLLVRPILRVATGRSASSTRRLGRR
jgi:hypothetical protein